MVDDEYDELEIDDSIYENNIDDDLSLEKDNVSDINDDLEFTDVIKELKYQMKFVEPNRKFIKVKINKKKIKVVPICEFNKSGTFVLKTEDGSIIRAKKSEISR